MKRIHTERDLAINGAAPALAEQAHVGRPNIGDRAAFMSRIESILDRQWLTNGGPMVEEFEARVASHLGVRHCVAMCNGTIALEIAIRALELHGEVIVPSWTFVATAHALSWQGITPVFADIDPATHNIDPEAVARMITPRTTGIIGVHLWGRAAPVQALSDLANDRGLVLMFDAAHAFGSFHAGRPIGGFGACEVFSFHATKSFNSMEGGAVTTDDDDLARKMRLMRNFGFAGYDDVIHPGTNGKMAEACAAMGLTNLDALDDIVAANRQAHAAYRDALAGIPGISLLGYLAEERNSHHYVVVELGDDFGSSRDSLVAALQGENILARRYFWPGCHRMSPYRELTPHAGLMLPETERLAERVVVLPTGPNLPPGTIDVVADVCRVMASGS